MKTIPAVLSSVILAGWVPVQAAVQASPVVSQTAVPSLPALAVPALETGALFPSGAALALPEPGLEPLKLDRYPGLEPGSGLRPKRQLLDPGLRRDEDAGHVTHDTAQSRGGAKGAPAGAQRKKALRAGEKGPEFQRLSARGLLGRTVSALLHPEQESPESALARTFDLSQPRLDAPAQAVEAGAAASAPKFDLRTRTFVLDNGLTLVVQPDFSVPAAAVSITYKAGSMDERPGEFGWAHLVEHLMFDGTEAYPGKSFDRLLAAFGGNSNAATGPADTTYHELVTLDGLEKVLNLEADRMRGPALRPDLFANELQVVLQERRTRDADQPYIPAYDRIFSSVFAGSGKAHATVGLEEDLRPATPESVRAFIARHYAPNNAVIVIAGAVAPGRALRMVREAFGRIPARTLPKRDPGRVPPLQGSREFTVQDPLARTPASFIAWHMPPRESGDFWALTLLARIFNQGDASPLYQALGKAAKLVFGLSVGAPEHGEVRGTEIFDFSADLMPGIPGARVVAAFDEVLRRFAEQGPSEKELGLAKSMAELEWLAGLESMEERASLLSRYAALVADPSRMAADLSELLAVTAEDIARAVKAWLLDRGRVVVHDVPVAASDESRESEPQPEAGTAVLDGLSLEELLKDAPALPQAELPAASSMLLGNGLRVVVVRDARLPLVQARLSIPKGPEGEPGAQEAVADLLFSGTKEKTAQELNEELSRLGYEVGVSNGLDAIRLRAAGLSRNLGSFLQELLGPLSGAVYPDDEVSIWLGQAEQELRARESEPDILAMDRLMAEVFKGHPYGRLLKRRDLKDVTPGRLRELHARAWSPEGALLLLYGDVDPESVRPLLERSLGRWRGGGEKEPLPAPPPSRAKTVFIQRKGSKQATLAMGLSVPLTIAEEDYVPFLVLDEVFGASEGSRLHQNLREAHGYTYGVFSNVEKFKDRLLWAIRGGARAEALRESLLEIRKELERIRSERVGETELAAAKRRLVGSYLMNLTSLSQKAARMEVHIDAGQDPAQALKARIRRIESLTADELLEVARKYLDPDKLVTVIVGDKAALSSQLAGTASSRRKPGPRISR